MSNECYIIAAKRTAVAPRNGGLSDLNLHELSAPVIRALLKDANINSSDVSELIVGNALGAGGNPARVIALASGLPESLAGLSIDRQCCSGMDAILLGKDMITSGRASIVIAGGVESYSQRPTRSITNPLTKKVEAYDQPPFTPWADRDPKMSDAADALGKHGNISFEEQNEWAVSSHHKAMESKPRLANEIVPLAGLTQDSFSRELSLRVCERATRIVGDISNANAAVAADAAAYCLLVSQDIAEAFSGYKTRIGAGITLGAKPELPGLAPVAAIEKCLFEEGISTSDLQCTEIMEAYAVQAIACINKSGIAKDTCNLGGGALSRGHPIAASGAILLTRLFHELKLREGYGLAAIAAAGGLGSAVVLQSE